MDAEDPELAHAIALSKQEHEKQQRDIWDDLSGPSGSTPGRSQSNSMIARKLIIPTVPVDDFASASKVPNMKHQTPDSTTKSSGTMTRTSTKGSSHIAKHPPADPFSVSSASTPKFTHGPSDAASTPTITEDPHKPKALFSDSDSDGDDVMEISSTIKPPSVNTPSKKPLIKPLSSKAPSVAQIPKASVQLTPKSRVAPRSTANKRSIPELDLDTLWTEEEKQQRTKVFIESLYRLYGVSKTHTSKTPLSSSKPVGGQQGGSSPRLSRSPDVQASRAKRAKGTFDVDEFGYEFETVGNFKGSVGQAIGGERQSKYFPATPRAGREKVPVNSAPKSDTPLPRARRPGSSSNASNAQLSLKTPGKGRPVAKAASAAKGINTPKSHIRIEYGKINEVSDDEGTAAGPGDESGDVADMNIDHQTFSDEVVPSSQPQHQQNPFLVGQRSSGSSSDQRKPLTYMGPTLPDDEVGETWVEEDHEDFMSNGAASGTAKSSTAPLLETPSNRKKQPGTKLQMSQFRQPAASRPTSSSTPIQTKPQTTTFPSLNALSSPLLGASSPLLVDCSQTIDFDPEAAKTLPAYEQPLELSPPRQSQSASAGATSYTARVEMTGHFGHLGITPSASAGGSASKGKAPLKTPTIRDRVEQQQLRSQQRTRSVSEKIECPLCNKKFDKASVEEHSAGCGDGSEEGSGNGTEVEADLWEWEGSKSVSGTTERQRRRSALAAMKNIKKKRKFNEDLDGEIKNDFGSAKEGGSGGSAGKRRKTKMVVERGEPEQGECVVCHEMVDVEELEDHTNAHFSDEEGERGGSTRNRGQHHSAGNPLTRETDTHAMDPDSVDVLSDTEAGESPPSGLNTSIPLGNDHHLDDLIDGDSWCNHPQEDISYGEDEDFTNGNEEDEEEPPLSPLEG
ncbi:hypothetical protein HK097_001819, partial [Rhizophlyctis rosea]